MPRQLEVTKSLDLEYLKSLAGVGGPCLTLFLPIEKAPNTTRLEEMRLKSVGRSAEQALTERGVDAATIHQLLQPIPEIGDEREHWGSTLGGTLVVLRSKDTFRAFEVRQRLNEAVHAGHHFQIRPILKSLQEDQIEFYLLALSQNHVRLLRCTHYEAVEIPLPEGVPSSMEEWLDTRLPNSAPDHGAEPAGGTFTSTTDRDRKDEFVQNYFRVINKGLTEMFKDESVPMILCGVDSQQAMYRAVNTYETLVEHGVQGSPESLKGGEMHKRALEIAREHAKEPLKKALGIYEKLGGTERVSANPVEILNGAHNGRVAFLFLSEDGSYDGQYDENSMEVSHDGIQEDLLNLAALKTIAFGGEVFITKPGRIPEQAPMAAIFRF